MTTGHEDYLGDLWDLLPVDPTDFLEDDPTEDEAEKAPTSEWAFDHKANVNAHHTKFTITEHDLAARHALAVLDPLVCSEAEAAALIIGAFQNPPIEDEDEKAPTSEWAFDHNADVNRHHAQVHNHDGDTLQLDGVNSNVGAFPFNITGAITFNHDVISSGGNFKLDNQKALYIKDSGGTYRYIMLVNAANDVAFGNTSLDDIVFYAGASGDIGLFCGGAFRMFVRYSGRVGIGITAPTAQLHVDQSEALFPLPVLALDQANVGQEMIEFISTIGVGNAIEAANGKVLTATHYIKVTIPGPLTRYIAVGTIA